MKEEKTDLSVNKKAARRRSGKTFKTVVNWIVIIFGGLYFCFHVWFVVWHALNAQEWLLELVKAHYAALIGLPFAAYAAVCLVLFLESRYDDAIEFKAPGFEFKGASGPIILWAICFLTIAVCMKILWNV